MILWSTYMIKYSDTYNLSWVNRESSSKQGRVAEQGRLVEVTYLVNFSSGNNRLV